MLDIATGKDPKQILKERVDAYQRDPEAVIRDLRTIQRDFNTLMTALTGRVRQTWGEKEVKVPEQKKYVKYTQNYMSRTIVDFDNGTIVVETLDDKAPKESLKNAIVTTLLTPDDPRSVDLFSDKPVTLTSDRPPYLLGLVLDQQGQPIRTPAQAEAFATSTLETATKIKTGGPERNRKASADRRNQDGGELLEQASGKIPSHRYPICGAIQDQPKPHFCCYSNGKQLQPLRR